MSKRTSEHGSQKHRLGAAPEWHAEARALHAQGYGYGSIATLLGKAGSTVKWALRPRDRAAAYLRVKRNRAKAMAALSISTRAGEAA